MHEAHETSAIPARDIISKAKSMESGMAEATISRHGDSEEDERMAIRGERRKSNYAPRIEDLGDEVVRS